MTPLVLGLIALAAVVHATWNLGVKKAGATGAVFLWLAFLVGAIAYLPFGVWSLIDSGANLWHWLGFASISGALQVVYFLLLQTGYRVGDVSVVYPLARGTGPLLSVIFAMLLFAERPSVIALAGAAVVIAGVITIGFAGGRSRAADNRAGVIFGLVIGVLIAVYTLWDSAAVTIGGMPVVGVYWGSVVFQFLLMAPLGLRERARMREVAKGHWALVLTVGILAPLGYILILLAIQLAPVSLVAPARETKLLLECTSGIGSEYSVDRHPENCLECLCGGGTPLSVYSEVRAGRSLGGSLIVAHFVTGGASGITPLLLCFGLRLLR